MYEDMSVRGHECTRTRVYEDKNVPEVVPEVTYQSCDLIDQ